MMSDVDEDGSGMIDFDEFLDMMTAKMVMMFSPNIWKNHPHYSYRAYLNLWSEW